MFDESCYNCKHNSKQIDEHKNWCNNPIKGMQPRIEYTQGNCEEHQRKKNHSPQFPKPPITQKPNPPPTQLHNPRKPPTLSQKTTNEWKTQFQNWNGEKE